MKGRKKSSWTALSPGSQAPRLSAVLFPSLIQGRQSQTPSNVVVAMLCWTSSYDSGHTPEGKTGIKPDPSHPEHWGVVTGLEGLPNSAGKPQLGITGRPDPEPWHRDPRTMGDSE